VRFALFCHSLLSDWNHGNAHFLRGIASELIAGGHQVDIHEPVDGWSLRNLRAEQGEGPIHAFHAAYPQLRSSFYDLASLDLDEVLDGVDVVIVHEWNDPVLVARLGRYRSTWTRSFRLLFHDTHHRAVSAAEEIQACDLSGYDGVLAFGEVLRQRYERQGWARRAWTWHEAADTRRFVPLQLPKTLDLVWVGNGGDGERTREILEFLVTPARALRLRTRVHGVRYPEELLRALHDAAIEQGGWVANLQVPAVFAQARFTVHVPRRFYREQLPGIPTIRVFEALACAMPLVSASWEDAERLFHPGSDYLIAHNGAQMREHLRSLACDPGLARELAEHGRRTILERHTCAHRVRELLAICHALTANAGNATPARLDTQLTPCEPARAATLP
jgi:spore maturation protein CgeB